MDEEAAAGHFPGVEELVEVAADAGAGVEGFLGGGRGRDELERLPGDGLGGLFRQPAQFDEPAENLALLLLGLVGMAVGGAGVGGADDPGEKGALGGGEVAGGAGEVGAGGGVDAVGAGAEVDAVEVGGEDFVLAEVFFEAEGEGGFEELAVEGFLPDPVGVPGELHGQGGGSLGEGAVAQVSEKGAGEAAEVDAPVVHEFRVLAGEGGPG